MLFGSLFGVPLCYDVVHDEVYLAGTGLVLLQNGVWCYSDEELRLICSGYRRGVDVEIVR